MLDRYDWNGMCNGMWSLVATVYDLCGDEGAHHLWMNVGFGA